MKIMIVREKILEIIFIWISDDWIYILMFKENKLLFILYKVDCMCRYRGMVGIFESEIVYILYS